MKIAFVTPFIGQCRAASCFLHESTHVKEEGACMMNVDGQSVFGTFVR